jgi:serine/threonine protein kinase
MSGTMEPIRFGRYVLLERIGKGGMGEVFLAVERGVLERFVVVKRLRPDLSANANVLTMFLAEARIAALLQHPNVVQIYDVGRHAGYHFMSMQYVQGATLSSLERHAAAAGTLLPVWYVVSVAIEIARALAHSHAARTVTGTALGLVHRDVTPSNIALGVEGEVKVLDFGVAKSQLNTETDEYLIGKVGYMAPEMVTGLGVDARADLYSLGVVVLEMLLGTHPFRGTTNAPTSRDIPPELEASEAATSLSIGRPDEAPSLRGAASTDHDPSIAAAPGSRRQKIGAGLSGILVPAIASKRDDVPDALEQLVSELLGPRDVRPGAAELVSRLDDIARRERYDLGASARIGILRSLAPAAALAPPRLRNVLRNRVLFARIESHARWIGDGAADGMDDLDVQLARSAEEATAALAAAPADVVVAYGDSGEKCVAFLHGLIEDHPSTDRVLVLGEPNGMVLMDAINEARVTRIIPEPWTSEQVLKAIRLVLAGRHGASLAIAARATDGSAEIDIDIVEDLAISESGAAEDGGLDVGSQRLSRELAHALAICPSVHAVVLELGRAARDLALGPFSGAAPIVDAKLLGQLDGVMLPGDLLLRTHETELALVLCERDASEVEALARAAARSVSTLAGPRSGAAVRVVTASIPKDYRSPDAAVVGLRRKLDVAGASSR